MLTPTYLEQLPEPMIELVSRLQNEIIADITKRIVKGKYDTPSAQWMLYKANQLRLSSADVNKIIAKDAKLRERTIRDMYSDSVKLALHDDAEIYRYAISENKLPAENGEKITSYFRDVAHNDFFRRGFKNTQGLMRNLTNSMAAAANRTLSDALDLAWLEVSSGAFTVDEACFKAVTALTEKGLAVVEYKSGHKDQVDVAVRRAVRTGINKTCCDMQLDFAAEMGSDLVEVSSHLGARPTHADWQGQIYSISGKHPKYKPFSVTGYGTGDGLGGWNCRHSFFPYFEGISLAANMPDFSAEENREMYDNQQQQRAYERAVRKSKRELAGIDAARQATADPVLKAKLDKEFERKSVTLKNREERLKNWCGEKGLAMDSSRVRTAGFGRSVSQKAVWAAKKKINNGIHSIAGSGESQDSSNSASSSANNLTFKSNGGIITPSFKFTEDTSPKFQAAFIGQYNKAVQIFGEITTIDTVGVLYTDKSSKVYGEYNDNRFTLNIRNAEKNNFISIMNDICKKQKDSGEWSTDNARHTIRHEIGHAIVNQHNIYDPMWHEKSVEISTLFAQFKMSSVSLKDTLSKYGFDDANEMMAESIAEYLNGNPRQLSFDVVKIILGK